MLACAHAKSLNLPTETGDRFRNLGAESLEQRINEHIYIKHQRITDLFFMNAVHDHSC